MEHVWAYDSSEDDDDAHEPPVRSAAAIELEGLTRVQTDGFPGQAAPSGRATLRALFESIDRDSDGWIDRQDLLDALQNNPRVREFLGLPAEIERGGVWHAAFETVFQCFDTADSSGGHVTWEEFLAHNQRARQLIKAQRPLLTPEQIREKVTAVWGHLDPYQAGMVTRVDLERDLMQLAFQIPSVRTLYELVEGRDAMVVDAEDWAEDIQAWITRYEQRMALQQEKGPARTQSQDRMHVLLEAGSKSEGSTGESREPPPASADASADEGTPPGSPDYARLESDRIKAEAKAKLLQQRAEDAQRNAEYNANVSPERKAGEAKKAWQAAAQHANLVVRLREAEAGAKRKDPFTLRFEAGSTLGLGFAKRGTGDKDLSCALSKISGAVRSRSFYTASS